MHPGPLPANGYDSGVSQGGKMPGNLRLRLAQYLNEIADAKLLVAHEV
ncbi:hypothetical protein ACPOL_0832 [Acidisarcina polymorpha]|uniref:Uncharacterized protein n=1 Tax=Acidisarcina polymorpha TaxID=2211140 RepID=A0A2Z5FTN4_9BACT|nr:hypothetical protein ACPOL_0832 [Acidisarcina polymorpha]